MKTSRSFATVSRQLNVVRENLGRDCHPTKNLRFLLQCRIPRNGILGAGIAISNLFDMASASSAGRLCMLACRRALRVPRMPRTQPIAWRAPTASRAFTSSPRRLADKNADQDGEDGDGGLYKTLDLKLMNKSFLESVTPEGLKQLDELAKTNGYTSVEEYLEATLRETPGWSSEDRALEEDLYRDDAGDKPNKSSFWFDEDDPETNTEEHDEFDEDDITSMAHGKLDEVRDMRHYARLAIWEMPLLASKPPPETTVFFFFFFLTILYI